MAHPNESLVRDGYDAFSKGDLDALRELFADGVKWHVPGRNQLAGDYEGQEAVFGLFAKLVQETEGTFKLEVHDILANDEHAVVLANATAERGGRSLESRDAHVMHIVDGKVTEFWNQPSDQHAVDEFWG